MASLFVPIGRVHRIDLCDRDMVDNQLSYVACSSYSNDYPRNNSKNKRVARVIGDKSRPSLGRSMMPRMMSLLVICSFLETSTNGWFGVLSVPAVTAFQVRDQHGRVTFVRNVKVLSKDPHSYYRRRNAYWSLLPQLCASSVPAEDAYHGPIMVDDTATTDTSLSSQPGMRAVLQLAELGLDIAVGTSIVCPAQLGLFVRCSDGVDSVTLPECTLLCGYANPGTFLSTDVGDKTVGFSFTNRSTAVFFQRKLMELGDALQLAALELGGGACGLAGHELSLLEKDHLVIQPVQQDGFDRFFCPDLVNAGGNYDHDDMITIQNFGQFCNDLAWDSLSPPTTLEEYTEQSARNNCVQLVWRLEYDESCQCLVPSWPVSVLSRDVCFQNHEFMELGTRYGWGFWQATVQLEDL